MNIVPLAGIVFAVFLLGEHIVLSQISGGILIIGGIILAQIKINNKNGGNSLKKDLSGRVAIVTGGGKGIGAAISWRLAREGAQVMVADLDAAGAENVAAGIRGEGLSAVSHQVDVSSASQVREMARRGEEKLGKIDILVNNAGILGPAAPVQDLSLDDWNRILNINLTGTFLCSQAVLKGMIGRGYGRILNLASVAGKEGNPNQAGYSTSKAGVIGFTKTLAKEVATTGVTVNCISPALTDSDMIREMSESHLKFLLAKIPMGRVGKPEEIAALVKYLVSEEAGFTTGACYDISGGRSDY